MRYLLLAGSALLALGAAPAVGEDAVELAAQLGAAAALGTTALSAALLKAASLDASALRRALEFSLSAGGRPAPGTAPGAKGQGRPSKGQGRQWTAAERAALRLPPAEGT